MIAKGTSGKSFYGLLKYLLDEDKHPELIHSSGVIGTKDPSILANYFTAVSNRNTKVVKPVWHFSLALSPEDAHRIDNELLENISRDFMQLMNLDDNQYQVISHNDTMHPHLHIVSNRIGYDGKCKADKMYKKRAMEASKALEIKYGLIKAKDKSRSVVTTPKPLHYAFKPTIDKLYKDVGDILRRELKSSHKSKIDLDKRLLEYGLKLSHSEKLDPITSTAYETVEIDFEHYDNRQKKNIPQSTSLNRGKCGKNMHDEELLALIEESRQSAKKKADLMRQTIKEQGELYLNPKGEYGASVSHFITALSLHDVDITESSYRTLIVNQGHTIGVQDEIRNSIEHAFIGGLKLKQSILNNTFQEKIKESKDLVFFMSKKDVDIIGKDKVDTFYENVLDSKQVSDQLLRGMIKRKRASSDTLYYILNNTENASLNYNQLKVDYEFVKTYLKVSKKAPFESKSVNIQQDLITHARIFKNSQAPEKDVYKFLARRGIILLIENGNIVLSSEEGKIGLASKLGFDMLKRHSKLAQEFDRDKFDSTFKKEYSKESYKYYRLLDKNKLKTVLNTMVSKKEVFNINEEELKYWGEDFGPIINNAIQKKNAKISSNYVKPTRRYGKK